jgi:hypothetical protein
MRDLVNEALRTEQFVCSILEKYFKVTWDDVEHVSYINPKCVYDIRINDLTFDVKHSSPTLISNKKKAKTWNFDLRKKTDYCNYVVLVGLIYNRFDKIFLIPINKTPKRWIRISICGLSKWYEYKIWEYKK